MDTRMRSEDTTSPWKNSDAKEKRRTSTKDDDRSYQTNADINTTNKMLNEYKKMLVIQHEEKTLAQEPNIWDYYKPSDEMEDGKVDGQVGS